MRSSAALTKKGLIIQWARIVPHARIGREETGGPGNWIRVDGRRHYLRLEVQRLNNRPASGEELRIPPSPPRSLNKCGVLFKSDPDYLAAAAAGSPGGTIRSMKVETFSPGLNGPGVWLLTGFKLLRKAAIAMASSAVSFAKACQGMIGARMRPSGRSPTCIAFTICSRVQLPMPVLLSGVMFEPKKTP